MHGVTTWGVFQGLFGLASNELYWLVFAETSQLLLRLEQTLVDSELEIVNCKQLVATVRSTAHQARSQLGVYVFRWFAINHAHVDKIATLSQQAWESFEAGFDTEVQGLFVERIRQAQHGTIYWSPGTKTSACGS